MASKQAELALGRILALASRPEQPGDGADYERCRRLIMDELAEPHHFIDRSPDYSRDRLKGAQGDHP